MRHAESEANAAGRVSDSGADMNITDRGREQA
ncbi:histidine phosphatase family protein [Candidatus Peribacteria bacterium]|nr:histidine phosphatase family protein [Candidatus Peribacteria bacterium]